MFIDLIPLIGLVGCIIRLIFLKPEPRGEDGKYTSQQNLKELAYIACMLFGIFWISVIVYSAFFARH